MSLTLLLYLCDLFLADRTFPQYPYRIPAAVDDRAGSGKSRLSLHNGIDIRAGCGDLLRIAAYRLPGAVRTGHIDRASGLTYDPVQCVRRCHPHRHSIHTAVDICRHMLFLFQNKRYRTGHERIDQLSGFLTDIRDRLDLSAVAAHQRECLVFRPVFHIAQIFLRLHGIHACTHSVDGICCNGDHTVTAQDLCSCFDIRFLKHFHTFSFPVYVIIHNEVMITMIRFDSDYIEGCIPEILEALAKTNSEQTSGYGEDPHCEHARQLIREAVGCADADVHFLVGGTQANTTVIASVLRPHQGALCAETGHIACHETGALEAAGHKCLTLPTEDGTITAEQVEAAVTAHYSDESFEHIVQPGLVYISYPTESGTLYSRAQLKALYETCQKFDIPLFIDGARLGYGLCSKYSDLTMQDIAAYSDIFYIGGTKVGALFGEAVVITNPKYKKDFRYHIKQRGGMLAKGRMLGIQFEELFTDDRYMKISRHAIAMAEKLTDGLRAKGVEFRYEAVTNQIFPILSNSMITKLRDSGFSFHTWGAVDENHTAVRFVTSFMTPPENIDALLAQF